jgi:hypothetical protein
VREAGRENARAVQPLGGRTGVGDGVESWSGCACVGSAVWNHETLEVGVVALESAMSREGTKMVYDSVWILDDVGTAMRNENLDGGDVLVDQHLLGPHVGLAKVRTVDGDSQRAHRHRLSPSVVVWGVGSPRTSLFAYFDDVDVDFVSDRNRSDGS